jgi:hypothetical protein
MTNPVVLLALILFTFSVKAQTKTVQKEDNAKTTVSSNPLQADKNI